MRGLGENAQASGVDTHHNFQGGNEDRGEDGIECDRFLVAAHRLRTELRIVRSESAFGLDFRHGMIIACCADRANEESDLPVLRFSRKPLRGAVSPRFLLCAVALVLLAAIRFAQSNSAKPPQPSRKLAAERLPPMTW